MFKKVLLIYLIWLVVINIFAVYALNRFNLNVDTAYSWINSKEFYQHKDVDVMKLRVHWDSFWYLKIATQGYEYIPGKTSSIAFFPLYPASIWVLSKVTFINPDLAGWIISTVALGVGLIFLYKLAKQFHPEIDPLEPIVYLLIFPTAFFLNSVYTESLFLMLSIIFFYYLLRKQFFIAAVFLSLASVCRINGLFLFVPFLIEYFQSFGVKGLFNKRLISLAVALIGMLSIMFYQYLLFNEPLAFLKAQMEWGRKFVINTEHLNFVSPASYANLSTDLLFLSVFIIAGILLIKYIKASYGFYVLTTIFVAISTGTLMSMSRFCLILFPVFIGVAWLKNKYFKFGWVVVSVLLLASYITLFVNNYWAG